MMLTRSPLNTSTALKDSTMKRATPVISKASHAVIYTRTSTGEQLLGHDGQRLECERMAAALGLEVVAVYSEHVSGSVSPMARDRFQLALERLGRGDVLLVWKRDRLGRDMADNAIAEREIARRGARLASSDVRDDGDAASVLMKGICDMFAQHERELIRQRTRSALEAKRERGEALGNVPLGHRRGADGQLEVDEVEAANIAQVRAKRAEGVSLEALASWCKERGIVTRAGAAPGRRVLGSWCRGVDVVVERKAAAVTASKTSPTLEDRLVGLWSYVEALLSQGFTLRAIAERVAEARYTTSSGKPISHQQLHRLVKRHRSC